MTDREFLWWVADRIVQVYGEHPYIDFVGKLASIADATPKKRETPNTMNYIPESLRRG
jgi:hypothetical protein